MKKEINEQIRSFQSNLISKVKWEMRYNLKQVAALLDIDAGSMSRSNTGERILTTHEIIILANACGLSDADLGDALRVAYGK